MQERKQPETLRLRAVMPAITVGDVARGARDFAVVDPDGFTISISTGMEDG